MRRKLILIISAISITLLFAVSNDHSVEAKNFKGTEEVLPMTELEFSSGMASQYPEEILPMTELEFSPYSAE